VPPDLRIDLEPRLVPRDSRFLLLGEEARQVEMRLSGPCRGDDELVAQVARMGAGAEVLQSSPAVGHAAEGRAEVFDGEDRGFEGADGCSGHRVSFGFLGSTMMDRLQTTLRQNSKASLSK